MSFSEHAQVAGWSLLLAFLLTALIGCAPGRQLDVAFTSLQFANESQVVLRSTDTQFRRFATTLYDLEAHRALWTREVAPPDALSPSGAHGVFVEPDESGPEGKGGRLHVLDVKRGVERILDVWVKDDKASDYTQQRAHASDHLAISDDGARVAVYSSGEVRMYSTGTNALEAALPYKDVDEVALAFLPGDAGLVVHDAVHARSPEGARLDAYTPHVGVFRRSGGEWRREVTLVAWSWAVAGTSILLVTEEGLVRYENGQARLIVSGTIDSYVDVAPDGRTVAFEYEKSLRVYRLDPVQQLFSAKRGEQFRLGRRRLVVFDGDGDVVAYALPSGKARRLHSFGQRSSYQKNLYQEGASVQTHYSFSLGPAGRFGWYRSGSTDTAVEIEDR